MHVWIYAIMYHVAYFFSRYQPRGEKIGFIEHSESVEILTLIVIARNSRSENAETH